MQNTMKYIHTPFKDFSFENFYILIKTNFKLNSTYSILIKISYYEQMVFKMCGSQIGLVLEETYDINYIEKIYNTILYTIESTIENYNITEGVDSVEIVYTIINTLPELRLNHIKNLDIPKGILSKKDFNKDFNQYNIPLTTNIKYFGIPLQDIEKKEFLNTINKAKNMFNITYPIQNTDLFHLYEKENIISKKKIQIIIVSKEDRNNNYTRFIFDYKSGLLIKKVVDIIQNSTEFDRTIGNITLSLNNERVIKYDLNINLPSIKPKFNVLKQEPNINIGSFDLETFLNNNGISKVYALGFLTNIDTNCNLFYLSDYTDSDQLILACLNSMLISKYHNFIFYCHNFGKYDLVFILRIIKEYNLKLGYDYYQISTIIRDDVIIKLKLQIKSSSNKSIKIILLDSLNLLKGNLTSLAKDFNVHTQKGVFPYRFVNECNITYKGDMPSISYYENINLNDYNELKTNN
jgi:DNA polymerase type B, organellar and viral